jgi:hypothetical protein
MLADTVKLLGVILDATLSFARFVTDAVREVRRKQCHRI